MTANDNKALARRWFELFNAGQLDRMEEFFAPTYDIHEPGIPPTLEGFKGFVAMLRAAFPDIQITIEDQIAESDLVVNRFTARGTHQGELFGLPPTGNAVVIKVIDIVRVRDGKMTEGWFSWDGLGLMQQIGAIPAPAGVAA